MFPRTLRELVTSRERDIPIPRAQPVRMEAGEEDQRTKNSFLSAFANWLIITCLAGQSLNRCEIHLTHIAVYHLCQYKIMIDWD